MKREALLVIILLASLPLILAVSSETSVEFITKAATAPVQNDSHLYLTLSIIIFLIIVVLLVWARIKRSHAKKAVIKKSSKKKKR